MKGVLSLFTLALTMLCVAVFAGGALAEDYNVVEGTPDHDITAKDGRMLPDCTNATPCVGDLVGSSVADLIRGFAGWDWVSALAGNDLVYGGPAMDQLYGGAGNDTLIGEGSHDHLYGDDGDDVLNAVDGADERGHVETAYGDREKFDQHGYDICKLDEDPVDGVVLSSCEKVIIVEVSGLDGKTPYGSQAQLDKNTPQGFITPGTYTDLIE